MSGGEIVIILQLLVKYGPEVAKWAQKLFTKGAMPTDADWAEIEKILEKTGESYFAPKGVQ